MEIQDLIEAQYGLTKLPEKTSYAMAYVPFQQLKSKTFNPEQGLIMGTMYQELNYPFYGKDCGDSSD